MRSPLLTRVASCLLGAFVCVELVYLPLANILQRVPRQLPPLPDEFITRRDREGRATDSDALQQAIDATGAACDRWGELTAQAQGWSLFAPRFGENGTFLSLQVVGTDATATELRSRFEPADPDDYVRFDVTNYRLFYREQSYAILYSTWTQDAFTTRAEAWQTDIRDTVIPFRRSLSAYVRWRLRGEYGGRPVGEVVVAVRVILPPKDGSRPPAVVVPLAKWVPGRPEEMAPFDPVAGTFAAWSK